MQKSASMATLDNHDLKAIKGLIEVTIDEAIEGKLVTKDDISHLPTKDEVVGQLKAAREEQAVLSHQVADHADRLVRIESNLAIPSN